MPCLAKRQLPNRETQLESEKECGYNFFEEESLDVKSLVLFEVKERVKKRDFQIEGLKSVCIVHLYSSPIYPWIL